MVDERDIMVLRHPFVQVKHKVYLVLLTKVNNIDKNQQHKIWDNADSKPANELSQRTRWVLVCLVYSVDEGFINRVKQLDTALNDDRRADLVIFHGDFPMRAFTQQLTNMSTRKVELYDANDFFGPFPAHFDPYMEDPNWHRRTKWGYHQVRTMQPSIP
jgi:hypothetical protein